MIWPSRYWSGPGVRGAAHAGPPPVPSQSVQGVPLSEGSASAPLTSMWPPTLPMVTVTGELAPQKPFGKVSGVPEVQ